MARISGSIMASCRCGQVEFAISSAPIMHIACYCNSCRTAGLQFQQQGAAPIVSEDGGTDVVVYRKDQVALITGQDLLSEHRLKPASPSRRMIATCCNTPMLGEFTKGHWLSFYRGRLPAAIPALEMRVMTADRPAAVSLPTDVPNYAGFSGKFMWKLLTSRVAMGFVKPSVSW
jgi:hypothetical protein